MQDYRVIKIHIGKVESPSAQDAVRYFGMDTKHALTIGRNME